MAHSISGSETASSVWRRGLSKKTAKTLLYTAGLSAPYLISLTLNMDSKGAYVAFVSLVRLLA